MFFWENKKIGGDIFEGIDRLTLRKLKKGKGIALFLHARKRCWERYHYYLNWKKYDEMCSLIRDLGSHKKLPEGSVSRIGTQSHSRSGWRISYDGRLFTIIYNNSYKMITTFLPEGSVPYGLESEFVD